MEEFCGHCGETTLPGTEGDPDHARCRARLVLEPPRFCTRCRRRMKVQVTPRGWTAACVEHGVLTG
jgi:hypothetical protein